MAWVIGFLTHTPVWVYVLLAYLVWIGIEARRPGTVGLARLAIIPALFTAWGLHDLVRLYGLSAGSVLPWLVAMALGALLGAWLVRRRPIRVDAQSGLIHHQGDTTLLPLVLVTFAVKYLFGVVGALSPETLAQPLWRLADLGGYGLFAGIFVGKFLTYLAHWLRAPRPAPRPAGT